MKREIKNVVYLIVNVKSLFKKGNKDDCGNYRGISPLSIADKILVRVILNRLITAISEEVLPET